MPWQTGPGKTSITHSFSSKLTHSVNPPLFFAVRQQGTGYFAAPVSHPFVAITEQNVWPVEDERRKGGKRITGDHFTTMRHGTGRVTVVIIMKQGMGCSSEEMHHLFDAEKKSPDAAGDGI